MARPLEAVVDIATREVLRWGYCDFRNDGQFEPGVVRIVAIPKPPKPDIDRANVKLAQGNDNEFEIEIPAPRNRGRR